MNDNHKLPDGVELSKDTTVFYPEVQWTFRRGEFVWSRTSSNRPDVESSANDKSVL